MPKKSPSPSKAITTSSPSKIFIVGPQASGKTTYLLALSLLYKSSTPIYGGGVVTVEPQEATKDFQANGDIKWKSGTPLEPTRLAPSVNQLPEYKFIIKVGKFNPTNIALNARDYGGEFFMELMTYPSPPRLKLYLDGCLNTDTTGCVIMLPDFIAESSRRANYENVDNFYLEVLHRFIQEAQERQVMQKLRLAIVMSKGERGELWPSRWEPERDLFQVRLRQTWELLRKKSSIPKKNLDFFTLSSFGVLDSKDSRPNRYILPDQDGAILKETAKWQPYGLINPLYWIATGKKWNHPSF